MTRRIQVGFNGIASGLYVAIKADQSRAASVYAVRSRIIVECTLKKEPLCGRVEPEAEQNIAELNHVLYAKLSGDVAGEFMKR